MFRINRVVGVVLVGGRKLGDGQAVSGHQDTAWSENSKPLCEQSILQLSGRHVVEHGKAGCAAEAVVVELESGGVTNDDGHSSTASEPFFQHGRELLVDF